MKTHIRYLIAVFSLLLLYNTGARAGSGWPDESGGIRYDKCGDGIQVIAPENGKYSGTKTIPLKVTWSATYNVVKISGDAFAGSDVTSVDIQSTYITTIETGTFKNCSKLTSITIPSSVTEIGESAFEGCSGLTSITIPSSIVKIGANAFKDCNITVVNITDLSKWKNIEFVNGNSNPLANKGGTIKVNGIELWDDTISSDVKPYAFYNCTSLKQLEVKSGSTIGEGAYQKCSNILSITPVSGTQTTIKNIKDYAFANCTNLNNVKFGNVTFIGKYAFQSCSNLKNLGIGQGKFPSAYLSKGSFSKCGIDTLIYNAPSKGVSIPDSAFEGSSLKHVEITGVSSIEVASFYGIESLLYFQSTDGYMQNIKDHAFDGCKALVKVNIKGEGMTFGQLAFYNCVKLDTVIIQVANNFPTIGSGTFGGISNTAILVLPNCSISKCPESVKDYFKGGVCNIADQSLYLQKVGNGAEVIYSNRYSFEKLTLPNSVTDANNKSYTITSIADGAFKDCSKLKEVICWSKNDMPSINAGKESFPSAIKSTASLCVPYSVAKDTAKKDSRNWISYFDKITGILSGSFYYSITAEKGSGQTRGKCEVSSPSNVEATEASIPDTVPYDGVTYNVTGIGNDAFKNCTKLAKVDMTKCSVIGYIGANSFYGCKALTSLTIPYTVNTIRDAAFKESGITSFVIPDAVTNVGVSAFEASAISSITIGKNVVKIDSNAFKECKSLKKSIFQSMESLCRINFVNKYSNPISQTGTFYLMSDTSNSVTEIVIPEGVDSINVNAFNGCTNITSVIIPKSVKVVGEGAFEGCTNLSDVKIVVKLEEGVERICKNAFKGCTKLTEIYLPSTIKYIEEGVFRNCSNLGSIAIPEKVKTIEKNTFDNCSSLKSVSFPDGLKSIGSEAFKSCSQLEQLKLPTGMDSIGKGMCEGCSALKSIDIPCNVRIIPSSSFKNCSSMKKVSIQSSINRIDTVAFNGCNKLDSCICYAHEVPALNPKTIEDTKDSIFTNTRNATILSIVDTTSNVIDKYKENGWTNYFDFDKNVKLSANSNIKYDTTTDKNGNKCVVISKGDSTSEYTYRGDIVIADSVIFTDTTKGTNEQLKVAAIADSAFAGTKITSVTLKGDVMYIGKCAFKDCDSLETVTIKRVDSISECAFGGCKRLKNLNISNAGDWCKIKFIDANSNPLSKTGTIFIEGAKKRTEEFDFYGDTIAKPYVLYGYTTMKRLAIPNSVTRISDSSFYNCSGLQEVYCYWTNNVPDLKNLKGVFDANTSKNATLYMPSQYVENYKNSGWDKYFDFSNIVEATNGISKTSKVVSAVDGGVKISGLIEGDEIALTDMNGNIVRSFVSKGEESVTIKATKGCYFLSIGSEEGEKIVIE